MNNLVMWGTHASVKRISDSICEKTYTDYTLIAIKDHVISSELFNKIKELDLNTFVKLYNYNYDPSRRQIISYTMEYYSPNDIDIMLINSSYIVSCFEKIYNDVITLSKNNVLIGDMNFSNIIFGDIIKVIDFDNYQLSNLSFEDILKNNMNELCFCFKNNYKIALYNEYSRSGFINYGIDNTMKLFDPRVEDLPSHVKKKLLKYDNMLEYFKDNSGK